MSEEYLLVDGEDSDHDELYVQKLDTLQHKMALISDDRTSTAHSREDGR
jgi:hypothetical protein